MWPGFDSQTLRHMWVEFVGSLRCTERFSPGTPVSPLLKKPTFDLICINCSFQFRVSPIVIIDIKRQSSSLSLFKRKMKHHYETVY